jgi:demethoxyubiquinone hydroxylase (CLK1/Coq7/Cat5 family)
LLFEFFYQSGAFGGISSDHVLSILASRFFKVDFHIGIDERVSPTKAVVYQIWGVMKSQLVRLLQDAHAGERAAGFAYNGHWRSVRGVNSAEIRKIEVEEWEHRACLFKMLCELGEKPRVSRELAMILVGSVIFVLCRLGGWLNVAGFGWFVSMYGAGKLEQGNIVEYQIAAKYARLAGYPHFVPELLHMAEIEWDHEFYFRSRCLESKWSRYVPIWMAPPARELVAREFD